MLLGMTGATPQAAALRTASRGVVYVASGPRYVDEAVRSAASLKRAMPDLPALLFTDQPDPGATVFDRIEPPAGARRSYIDTILPLLASPFERTLFLDSDTLVCGPLGDLFQVLDRFDLAVSHDSWRGPDPLGVCPDAFAELNTGVLLYRRTPAMERLIRRWHDRYEAIVAAAGGAPAPNDQRAFRAELYASGVPFYVLPVEYNFTAWCPAAAGAEARVVILHGRSRRLPEIARIVNQSHTWRVFLPTLWHVDRRWLGIYSRTGDAFLRTVTTVRRGLRRLSPR